ncbi:uncharacterized protein LOC134571067 [Pelobates fuscus]|uniref:uncharacterized protein LOC134571067 n=1 Tax=Pelobates fuscus TaxID=191477 RepID=UPI002FE4867A
MDPHQLKDYIYNFSLADSAQGGRGYNRVLLQLFGYTGHGKSSFINSCKFVLDGEYRTIAESGQRESGGAMTMVRNAYKLTDTITIVDNRGFKNMDNIEKIQINSQLANLLPLNQEVKWAEEYDDILCIINKKSDSDYTDIIVPIFVYSVKTNLTKDEDNEVREFLETCQEMTRINPTIVLTNKTSGNYSNVEERLGTKRVFPVENYTEDRQLATREKHIDILNIIKSVLDDVKFSLEHGSDPEEERTEHIKFLMGMAHRIFSAKELEKKEEEDRKKQKEMPVPNIFTRIWNAIFFVRK